MYVSVCVCSTPLNSKTFGGIMNIVAWLPFMSGYTMSFLLNQRIRSSKAKEVFGFTTSHTPSIFHCSRLTTVHI